MFMLDTAPSPSTTVSLTLTHGTVFLSICCFVLSLCLLYSVTFGSDSGKNLFVNFIPGDVTYPPLIPTVGRFFGLAPSPLQSLGKDTVSFSFKL